MLLAHKAEEKPIPVGQAHEGQGRADDAMCLGSHEPSAS